MKLTDTQRVILSQASQRPDGLAYPPERLPAAARQAVAKALLRHDLVIAVHRPAYDAIAKWMVDGDEMLLKITDAGLRAIGIEPESEVVEDIEAAFDPLTGTAGAAPVANTATTGGEDTAGPDEEPIPPYDSEEERAMQRAEAVEREIEAEEAQAAERAAKQAARARLRDAAAAVLAAWDDDANRAMDMVSALDGPMADLRAALAPKPARTTTPGERKPREGTKREAVIALLKRGEGTTIDEIMEATDWQAHTVRGFFAALKKQGWHISTTETARNPNDTRRRKMLVYRA